MFKSQKNEGLTSDNKPVFSVIICVFNDWEALGSCLRSLSEQKGAPYFEVLVVDDGSSERVNDRLRETNFSVPVQFINQRHAGPAAARNTGIRAASGDVFVFTDSDCILEGKCLRNLEASLAKYPQDSCFQLHLNGDPQNLVGRAEELRLSTLQTQLRMPDGYIHYLNTAGCAIRRSKLSGQVGLFDERAIRAQDTLLFADLLVSGERPRFVPAAMVQHRVRLNLRGYLWKGLRAGYVEGRTYSIIHGLGVSIRSNASRRGQIFLFMLKRSQEASLGILAFMIVTLRQILSHLGAMLYRSLTSPAGEFAHHSGLQSMDKRR